MMKRDEVSVGMVAELERFEELVRGLDDREWATPTRCDGWTVADVAAHVTGTMSDVVAGRLDGQGSPEVTARQVAERRGRTAAEVADELAGAAKAARDVLAMFDDAAWAAPAPGGYQGSLGDGVEALWYDTYLHGDDIRAAVGRSSLRGEGLRCSVHHVAHELTRLGWGPAILALNGIEEVPVGEGGEGGAGRRITGDPFQFVLASTGRADPTSIGLDPGINIYAN
jgi:uncharacterized protein (TIGR03083 family)